MDETTDMALANSNAEMQIHSQQAQSPGSQTSHLPTGACPSRVISIQT